MANIPQWRVGDVLSASKLNDMVDAINVLITGQTGNNETYITLDELNDILERYSDIGHTHSVSEIVNLVLPTKLSQLQNDTSYATENYVNNAIAKAQLGGPAYNDAELRSLIASLTKRVEELEKGNTNPPTGDEVKAKSYCGQINFKTVDDITIDDLENLDNLVEVTKPQTVYAHSGSTVYNKTLICAIPKAEGIISSVVDGAGVDITASYPVVEKTLNGVIYSISCNEVAQAYNKSTVVKFNIN